MIPIKLSHRHQSDVDGQHYGGLYECIQTPYTVIRGTEQRTQVRMLLQSCMGSRWIHSFVLMSITPLFKASSTIGVRVVSNVCKAGRNLMKCLILFWALFFGDVLARLFDRAIS